MLGRIRKDRHAVKRHADLADHTENCRGFGHDRVDGQPHGDRDCLVGGDIDAGVIHSRAAALRRRRHGQCRHRRRSGSPGRRASAGMPRQRDRAHRSRRSSSRCHRHRRAFQGRTVLFPVPREDSDGEFVAGRRGTVFERAIDGRPAPSRSSLGSNVARSACANAVSAAMNAPPNTRACRRMV